MFHFRLSSALASMMGIAALLFTYWDTPDLDRPEESWSSFTTPGFSMCRSGGQFLLEPLIDYSEPKAPKLAGLGNLHFSITTKSEEAQEFFDQGMRLVYAFNHAEAYRAFQEVSRLDPDCAMAYWGQALSLGPNINDPLPDMTRQKLAHQAIQKAADHTEGANATEKALIEAYQSRCTDQEVDQAVLNEAYAQAMEKVYKQFADHSEVGTLYAASVMNTMPWDYYTEDLKPKGTTTGAVKALEKVLESDPDHPGAHHYYIHIIESVDPDKAVGSADALTTSMPGAGHIVHMPSHIYIGVGMYEKAAQANRKAIEADETYIAQCQAQGMYPLAYYPHNIHFLWAAATMLGNSQEAIDAAQKVALRVPVSLAADIPFIQDFMSVPVQAFVRFGRWNDVLSTPPPDTSLLHAMMMWHFARGMAFTRKGMVPEAERELEAAKTIAEDPRSESILAAYTNPTTYVGKVAVATLAGEIAAQKGNLEEAVALLKEGVQHEMNLAYQEPSAWHHPVRHNLGAVLLQAGKAAEAEEVYLADLKKNRGNGWALFGLYQSLQAQGKIEEAKKARLQFEKAWQNADVALTASVF